MLVIFNRLQLIFKLAQQGVIFTSFSFQTLCLEISDLEAEVHKKTDAAKHLLQSNPQDVPPQLLTALEKDERSLSRTYSAAVELAQNTLQGLQVQRDAQKVKTILIRKVGIVVVFRKSVSLNHLDILAGSCK